MTEPVVLSLISCNGIGDTLGERKFETQVDCLLRALDHPFHNGFASVFAEVLGVVLDIAVSLDLCLERDNDQSAPDSGVLCAHLGQVIGIEHQRVAGNKAERVLVFLFSEYRVGRSQLLDHAGVQACAFFQLCGDHDALALGFCHFGLHIALAVHGQRIGREYCHCSCP